MCDSILSNKIEGEGSKKSGSNPIQVIEKLPKNKRKKGLDQKIRSIYRDIDLSFRAHQSKVVRK